MNRYLSIFLILLVSACAQSNNDVLREIKQLKGSDFEAVDVSSLMKDINSGQIK